MKLGDIVMLEWLDSCSNIGWSDPSSTSACTIRSVGILVNETDQEVVISTSHHPLSLRSVADPIAIPKVAILHIFSLRRKSLWRKVNVKAKAKNSSK